VALERLRKSAGCDTALYVGDDETDEDVFALDRPGHLLAIRVGRSMTSKAGHFIESQARIDDLLAELARLASLKGAAPRERRRA
jgi:trehalose 6-phosphate phosphatase